MFFADWLQRREMLSPNKVALIDAITDNQPITYREMLQRLGLTEEQGVYNADYGHLGEQDSIINIIEGVRQGRLKDGDLMIIVAAGIGYVWGATCVKWGPCETEQQL